MEEKNRSHGRLGIRLTLKPRDLMEDVVVKHAFQVQVITLFPEAFPGVLGLSITGKALDLGIWRLKPVNLRDFGEGKHRAVDDTPAGGGAGMVLRPDVMERAIEAGRGPGPLVFLTPRGKPFTQEMARRYAQGPGMTLICGRFEGLDQRVIEHYGIEEVSMGDFVLTGGEIPAQALIDATVRLLPRVLGNQDSAVEESFSDGLLEHPQYTRPAVWQGREVPAVLSSGNHAEIAKWRAAEGARVTQERRPDLWAAHEARAVKRLKGPALRKAIRAEVAAVPSPEGPEAEAIAAALAWIDSGAELMRGKRADLPPIQLAVSLVQMAEGRVLLQEGRVPSLVLTQGETPLEAVRRGARSLFQSVADLLAPGPLALSWADLGDHREVRLWYALAGQARGQVEGALSWALVEALAEAGEGALLHKIRGLITSA
jgi:tRNA (guanine37-N1)-methyltransferase